MSFGIIHPFLLNDTMNCRDFHPFVIKRYLETAPWAFFYHRSEDEVLVYCEECKGLWPPQLFKTNKNALDLKIHNCLKSHTHVNAFAHVLTAPTVKYVTYTEYSNVQNTPKWVKEPPPIEVDPIGRKFR